MSPSSEWSDYSRGGIGAAMDDEKIIGDEGARLPLLRLDAENEKMLFGEALDDDDDRALVKGNDGGRKHRDAAQNLIPDNTGEIVWIEKAPEKCLLDED